jgi:hypothetical protein
MDMMLLKMSVVAVIVFVLLFTLTVGLTMLTPSGKIIQKSIVSNPAKISSGCGNGVCENGENCISCPKDCSCVELKLTKQVEYSQVLLWCSAKVTYAAVNSGNSEATDVRLEIVSSAPHLDKVRDRKEVFLGNFPVNMTPLMGEVSVSYDCSDDIVSITTRLYDAEGHEYIEEVEKRR